MAWIVWWPATLYWLVFMGISATLGFIYI